MGKPHQIYDAMVLGLSETGLAVARSLSRKGLKVAGIHFGSENTPSSSSRHLDFIRGPALTDETALVKFYEKLGQEQEHKPVLCPTGDENVLFLYKHRNLLKKYFKFYIWESPDLTVLSSKVHFIKLTQQLELPVPKTLVHENRKQLFSEAGSMVFPCVIKPEHTHYWLSDLANKNGLYAKKALPVYSFSELESLYERIIAVSGNFILQKMIVGSDANHLEFPALVEPDGAIKSGFVAKKIRLMPAHYGMGCLVESVKCQEVVDLAINILDKLQYRGLGMVQFKRDDRDGQLYLLEINPRFTVWTGLPVACGFDLPYYYYQVCTGNRYEVPDDYPAGIKWWNPVRDVMAMNIYLKDGTWTFGKWFLSIISMPKNAYFSWDDPLPGINAMIVIIKYLLGAVRRRLFS